MSYLLYADDNEDMRTMVRTFLEASGHEVALVADGVQALDSIDRREPDLLILDLDMPNMSGIEVCRSVKGNPFTERIPVLMLTGQGAIESKIEGFEAGADDYLAKPFDPRELRARVTALLRLVRREADRNPTSGLPGGRAIESEIQRRLAAAQPFTVCYIDLDNFKAFADTFGFAIADRVIKATGVALVDALVTAGSPGDFVGHIGGDDFLIVSSAERAEAMVRECADRFRDVIRHAVGDEAVAKETFAGVDRDGTPRHFPIARLSAALLHVEPAHWVSIAHLGAQAAEVKRRAKRQGAGTILAGSV
ncbi:MAG TPA: response regulator [Gemmatimonadaceae bacterium]|nr:response regulator [Gemmatimonadaceae bacterium]